MLVEGLCGIRGQLRFALLNSIFIGEERSDIVRSLTIAGGLLGALAVILLILVTAVGTVILVKKGIINIIFYRSINKLYHNILFYYHVCIGSLGKRITKRKLT